MKRMLMGLVAVCMELGVAVVDSEHSAPAQPVARIKIETGRTIGKVDPQLFGNFAEHLGCRR